MGALGKTTRASPNLGHLLAHRVVVRPITLKLTTTLPGTHMSFAEVWVPSGCPPDHAKRTRLTRKWITPSLYSVPWLFLLVPCQTAHGSNGRVTGSVGSSGPSPRCARCVLAAQRKQSQQLSWSSSAMPPFCPTTASGPGMGAFPRDPRVK